MKVEEYLEQISNKLTMEEARVLMALEETSWGESLTVKDLITQLNLKSSAVSTAINKFRFVAWVKLIRNKGSHMYYITDLGKEALCMIKEKI